ncbi:MAG: hypothetical protein ACREUF_10040, partial [Solimonas sp.]
MGRAARIAEKRGRQMQAAANQIGKAVGVSMALFATGAAVAVKKAIDRADELDEMAQKVGASVQSLSRLQFVASRDGVDDFTNSMVKLNKAAVEAADKNSDQARAFAALGVSVTDANGKIRSTDQLFVDIAERFSMSEDGAAKAAVAMVLFGKSGADLIPMLNNGAAELARLAELADRLGVTIDEKTAAAAGRFN